MTQIIHSIMALPYSSDALEPYITKETIAYHYEKHHLTYVNNLNNLLDSLPIEDKLRSMQLQDIVIHSYNKPHIIGIFNNAAQVLNHDFYWLSVKSDGGDKSINTKLLDLIKEEFGDLNSFKQEFKKVGLSQFGSGWTWLVQDKITKKLLITKTSNADNPILYNQQPLFTCDVWEHAYYIDYRNKRAEYIETFLEKLVNWDFASKNLLN